MKQYSFTIYLLNWNKSYDKVISDADNLGWGGVGEQREEDQHHHKILQSFSLLLPFFSCLHFYFNKTFIYDLTFKDASALRDM